MKREIVFLDADRNKVVAECEIKERNGYPEFTMSGEYKGGLGQVFDRVNPANEQQQKLINLWKDWHLNGMNAGTPVQQEAIEKWKDEGNEYDYEKIVEYLKSIGLYEVPHPKTGEPYKYGHGWITKDLPEDFEDKLEWLLDEIEEIEEENKDREITKEDIDLFSDFSEPETALALALMLELSISDIDDIVEEGNNGWTVQGVDYLAGTDEEMDDAWDEDLDNYLEECVYPDLPDTLRNYFDDEAWKSDARMDGRGHSLNRYDGSEESVEIDGVWYFAYRQ